MFDILWYRAIPARQRIREVEEGIKREFIETIQEPTDIDKLIFKLIYSATCEISAIFPTAQAFKHYRHEGIIESLDEAIQRKVSVRVLTAYDYEVIRKEQKIDVRYLREPRILESRVITLLVDNQFSLIIELRDDKVKSSDAIGLATYSNSEATVSSYSSIFELLWIKSELHAKR